MSWFMRKRLYDHIFSQDDNLRLDVEYHVWYDDKGEVENIEVIEASYVTIDYVLGQAEIEVWPSGGHLEKYLEDLENGIS